MSLKSYIVAAMVAGVACVGFASAGYANPEFWQHEWPKTNFEKTSVKSWKEILSGGPAKDGIPALNDPSFIDVAAETRISGAEPVIAVELSGQRPRAYPIRYLTWHEIVNDSLGGVPFAVTFCPLCNSAITFDRRIEQGTITLGVSGKLRNSDMVMFDRETESWWQQAIGEAIVGDLLGTQLKTLPTWMESWDQFRARNPDGQVMAEPDYNRRYGVNPYRSYDSSKRPFLYNGEMPPHGVAPLERVVRVGDKAWRLQRLQVEHEIHDGDLVISWRPGQASALDTSDMGQGRDVGSIRVRDTAGNDLPHDVMFAFAFHAFWPAGQWMLGDD